MRTVLPLFLLLAVGIVLPTHATHAGVADRSWSFDVFLDGKRIGQHLFEVDRRESGQLVRSEADFEVRVLFFKAFSYEHRNRELWRDGCLYRIDAQTDSNGQPTQVRGARKDGRFVIQSSQGERVIEDCVATFAYWDRDLLQRDRLLNPQTGEYLRVDLRPRPSSVVVVEGREIEAERVHLRASDVDIVLSYAAGSGEWIGLESRLRNGRVLTYKRRSDDTPHTRVAVTPPAGRLE